MVILFLFGLTHLGAVAITGTIRGWLEIIDAVLFILEAVVPLVIPLPARRAPTE